MKLFQKILPFILIILSCSLFAENKRNDYSFDRRYFSTVFVTVDVKEQDVDELLLSGVRSFILNDEELSKSASYCFPIISSFLKSHPQEIISLLLTHNQNSVLLEQLLTKYNLNKLLFFDKNENGWASTTEMIKSGKRLVVFAQSPCNNIYALKSSVVFTSYSRIFNNYNELSHISRHSLICYTPTEYAKEATCSFDSILTRSLYFWRNRGHVPNFLVSPSSILSTSTRVVDSLNKITQYTGRITCNDKLLDDIQWTDHPTAMSSGSFSFPKINPNNELYSPRKDGYSFYPEVIKFDNNHRYYEIIATKLSLNDNLLYHFSFEKGSRNDVNPGDNNLSFKLSFKDDKVHGKVAVFNSNGAAIQCNKNSSFSTKSPFTISVWVKPYKVDGIYAIMGKGEIFSVKIRYKGLSFAGTGFSSKITNLKEIKANVWQHLTWVYFPNRHIRFFVNGKLIDKQAIKEISSNDHAITIGNNFSNEGFCGEMDELKIWDRALSTEEITSLYTTKPDHKGWTVFIIILAGCLSILSAFIFLFIRKRKKAVVPSKFPSTTTASVEKKQKQGVFLFGVPSVVNLSGEDVIASLTPKVTQLFLLLVLSRNGASINLINDELWPGMDEEKAKQNRNYSIQQLKKALSRITGIRLEYLSKKWMLEFDDDVYVDIYKHESLVTQIESGPNLVTIASEYLSLVERGRFLLNVNMEGLDQEKAKVADQIIESLLVLSKSADSKLRLRIGNALLLHDSLNEDGLRLCINGLVELGRNGEAHSIYNSFCKKYKNAYNEDFLTPFAKFF